MIKTQTVEMGEWLPDQPDIGNAVTVVENVLPATRSYRAVRRLTPLSNALDSRALDAVTAINSSGIRFNFAGDAGKLYRYVGGSYSDVSKGGGYTVEDWDFTKYGDRIIAASIDAPTQYFDMAAASAFVDLPNAPQAAAIAVIRDFVVMGNIAEQSARVQWSGFNNSEQWASSQATQADFQDLLGAGGKVQTIVSGEYGVVFQENSIWRMDYAGPPVIFRFDEVERGRGTLAPKSVTALGDMVYYWGLDGFYAFNGRVSQPIGEERVDRYVRENVDPSQLGNFRGAIDRRLKLVMWTVPFYFGNRVICYHWGSKRWSLINLDIQTFVEHGDVGYTLDDLDTILSDIDSQSIPVDSTDFLGGDTRLAAFNTDNKLGTFSGPAIDATIETGEMHSSGMNKMLARSVRPLVSGGATVTIQIGHRNDQSEPYTYTEAKSLNRIGEANFRQIGRYLRVKMNISGEFDHAAGAKVQYRDEGRL